MYRLLRLLIVLTLLSLLGSCGTVRLGYGNADTLVYWWLDGYVDFRSSQKAKIKLDLAQTLSWHRNTQLPQYIQALMQQQTKLVANPEPVEIAASMKQIEQFSQKVFLKVVPELTDLALSIDESQKIYLARKFEKNNEKYRESYILPTSEKLTKVRFKKIMKQADEWLGRVSREQEVAIASYVEKHPQNYQQWLEDSMARQRSVLSLLTKIQREKPSRELAQAMVQQMILASSEPAEQADRREQSDISRAAMQQLISTIIRLSSPEQKKYAHKKIQVWIDDCTYLLAEK